MDEFPEPDKVEMMAKRLQDLVDNSDDIFKKETEVHDQDIDLIDDNVNAMGLQPECPNATKPSTLLIPINTSAHLLKKS